jgi:hypothetical protein
MPLVKSPQGAHEVSDSAPVSPTKCGAPRSAVPSAQATPSARPQATQRRKTHPVTWAVAAILMPILGWDAWQSGREAKLPPMPVNVKVRPAVLGPGFVLMLENTSSRPLSLVARLEHPAIRDGKKFGLYVGPGSHVDVDRVSGWIAQSGDRITLENSNFKTWSGSIP